MLNSANLNEQQRLAAEHRQGPALVVAGAGTGKTHLITHRIAYLIEKELARPSEILAVTFTEKAAREMETRVSELLGKYVLDVKITTFNAFGYDVVRRFAYELGMSPDLELLSGAQQLIFLRDHLEELKLRYYSPVTRPEGLLVDLASYFSKLQGELLSPERYKKFVDNLRRSSKSLEQKAEAVRHYELAQAYRLYQQLKRRHNVIDFDDQVNLTVDLLQRFPNVREKLEQENRYILVDEFQDTNPAQSALIDLLAGKQQNLMVVGDDDQSIYRFRGAAMASILQFLERYPAAKRFTLTHNYRSSQQILDSAYSLIQNNNPDRLEAKYDIDKQLRGSSSGRKPRLKTFMTYDEEAQFIAYDIKRRIRKGQSAGEIAVLMRKNNQAHMVARYLEAEGVDYHIVGQTEDLYRQQDIKNLLNFLRIVADPRDTESFYHLLTSDIYGFDAAWLREYAAQANRQHQPLESILGEAAAMGAEPEIATKLERFLTELEAYRRQLSSLNVGHLCYQLLRETRYLPRLLRAAKKDPSLDQRIASLNHFFKSLREFEAVAEDPTAIGYLEALPALIGGGERVVSEDLPELFGQKVLLLTVHRAKGLEFELVYLFDLTQGNFPTRARRSSLEVPAELLQDNLILNGDPHSLEERRLAYVALTRAKRDLILSCSLDHGGKQAKRPSIFIEEALGEQAALHRLKAPKASSTDQIELFRVRRTGLGQPGFELPPTLLREGELLLTQRQIEDYLLCPAEFYLRHIIAPPQPASFALEYGNLMHSLVQFYNRSRLEGANIPLKKLLEYVETNWPQENFLSLAHKARSLKQARAAVTKFWQREQTALRRPAHIEYSFEFALPKLKTKIRGRFDAVYNDKPTEIRDYKTGATTIDTQGRADERTRTSFQLGVYALAWQKLKGEPPAVVALDFIDSGLVGRAAKSGRQLRNVEQKIMRAAEGIRAANFKPASSHLFCTHPQYGL